MVGKDRDSLEGNVSLGLEFRNMVLVSSLCGGSNPVRGKERLTDGGPWVREVAAFPGQHTSTSYGVHEVPALVEREVGEAILRNNRAAEPQRLQDQRFLRAGIGRE